MLPADDRTRPRITSNTMRADTSLWHHQVETFFALLALCAENSPSMVNSPHKGQWCGALMFSLNCTWINAWENNREVGDLRCHCAHYDVIVMWKYTIYNKLWYCCYMVNFLQNACKKHYNSPLGWEKEYFLWVQTLICILPSPLLYYTIYIPCHTRHKARLNFIYVILYCFMF